ncbi:hypothetical protein [Dehalogenimonas etheniformans]|uniref:Alpha/beta hydrolase n=1 Tax=Dehalogenimonas etheniformans TaxID=1536648 RepID=A0A2P5P5T7_9CHLR|nr:hypothetical protein [Dehalogenimonas etheniformans]PPD57662.1 hypothetical protein JP09_007935 [Dehalogenimonas etheniformans]QNT76004.1 hypothetical protein HX448_04520 [Dehalogenimonas etheniformans]
MIIAIAVIIALGLIVVFSWQMPDPGKMRHAFTALPLPPVILSQVPGTVRDDALEMAKSLHPRDKTKRIKLAADLLATYESLKNTDIFVLFNSGGYGWTALDKASGYATIVNAIEDEFITRHCRVLVLNYQRAYRSLRGYISEILNAGAKSVSKPRELALRLKFLWHHLPNLKVLMCAESNGTVMSNQVIKMLPEEERLFSIEFGPPFWYDNYVSDRVLNMRSNGVVPDAFSYGHWSRAFKANWDALRGKSPASPGNVLLYIGAPGHDYNWQDYPLIRENVLRFLNKHFNSCK